MNNIPKPSWPEPAETDDQFLRALFAAGELEKLGFCLNALRPDQVDELCDKFDLPVRCSE